MTDLWAGFLLHKHEYTQFTVWSLLADWFILYGRYKRLSPNQWYNIHGYALSLLCIWSLIFNENKTKYKRIPGFHETTLLELHKFIAGPSFAMTLGLMIVGTILRLMIVLKEDVFKKHRLITVTNIRKLHLIGGISMWVEAKLALLTGSYVYGSVYDSWMFTIVIVELLVFLIILGYLEMINRKAFESPNVQLMLSESSEVHVSTDPEEQRMMLDIRDNSKTCHDLARGYKSAKVFIYRNKVYQIGDDFTHPGGQWILESNRFRDVTRYLYGVTGLEFDADHRWTHSKQAFEALKGKCIGDLTVPFTGESLLNSWILRTGENEVAFSKEMWKLAQIVPKSVSVKLFKFKNTKFTVRLGLQGTKWMGKHFVLTGRTGVNRMYSTCLALTDEMNEYMAKLYKVYEFVEKNPNSKEELKLPTLERTIDYLPLTVKSYSDSSPDSVSHELHCASPGQLFLIDGPLGRGYEFSNDFAGKLVIIAGGTGYIPFVDLLASLYLKVLFKTMQVSNPTEDFRTKKKQYTSFLSNASVKLLASFKSEEEFYLKNHIINLYKICKANGLNDFDCVIKNIKYHFPPLVPPEKASAADSRFDASFLSQHVSQTTDLIIICGPPPMNQDIYECLTKSLNIDKERIVFQ